MGKTPKERPSGSKAPAKRHIRNFLIDRRFQLRWTIRVIIIVSLIVAIMGYFLYQTVADATDQMLAQKLGEEELTDASFEAFIEQADSDKRVTLYTLLIWLISLVVFIGLSTIVLTHRIAGPIYKMRKIFETIDGENLCLWENRLRKGDELKQVFEDFDDLLRRLREARRDDMTTLESIRAMLDKRDDCKDIVDKLDELIETYQKSVRMN